MGKSLSKEMASLVDSTADKVVDVVIDTLISIIIKKLNKKGSEIANERSSVFWLGYQIALDDVIKMVESIKVENKKKEE